MSEKEEPVKFRLGTEINAIIGKYFKHDPPRDYLTHEYVSELVWNSLAEFSEYRIIYYAPGQLIATVGPKGPKRGVGQAATVELATAAAFADALEMRSR